MKTRAAREVGHKATRTNNRARADKAMPTTRTKQFTNLVMWAM